MRPTFTTWGPGEVIALEHAAELAPRDYEMACRAGGDPARFVWVLHDAGSVGGWYADSLVPA